LNKKKRVSILNYQANFVILFNKLGLIYTYPELIKISSGQKKDEIKKQTSIL
jgi:hypothetical protein